VVYFCREVKHISIARYEVIINIAKYSSLLGHGTLMVGDWFLTFSRSWYRHSQVKAILKLLCSVFLKYACEHTLSFLDFEDESTLILQNSGNQSAIDTPSHPRTFKSPM